ncbi:MAG: rRNA maturation RNase YbeY [Gemmatimonadales bacterium]
MADVSVQGRPRAVPDALVRRAALAVLQGERREARLSITFLGRDAMRRLNREYKGEDRPTDVISFGLETPGLGLVGDVYVCPWVAEREARSRGVRPREEIVRLVVHGTLHVLGWDHPDGGGRVRSAMWRRQERYVGRLG